MPTSSDALNQGAAGYPTDRELQLSQLLAAAQERVNQLEAAKPEHWLPKSITVADIADKAHRLTLVLEEIKAANHAVAALVEKGLRV